MRRHFEDLFQAAAAALGGLLLVWAGSRLSGGELHPGGMLSFNSLADLQRAAGLAACAVGLLVLGWWAVGLAAAFLSALLARSGKQRAARAVGLFSPGFLRRLAAAALGVQLIAGPVPAALAAVPASSPGTASLMTGAYQPGILSLDSALDPGWQPDSVGDGQGTVAVDPAWKPAPDPVPASLLIPPGLRAEGGSPKTVTVVAGDTLWDLAAARLGPLATDAERAGMWPRWYELNRQVIGPDPNILLPGQILLVPPLAAG